MRPLAVVFAALAVAAPAAQAQPQPQALVSWVRTGGFIGSSDRMTIFGDGHASSTRGAFRLSTQRLRALRRSVEEARFATLVAKYRARVPIADGYTYTIRHSRRSVLVEEGAEVPARLQRLLLLLDDLFSRRR